ncbi:peptide chain release factor-like protein [Candidatus Pacearchaeota archaeon]|jgi:hypothetical protein|nr:peptide chain release factor-like protein [Candidatus Pacearchaeota archaeon]
MKKLLFSITKKDLEFDYFSGTGNGGQNRNKHQKCVRCKHPPSGAVGIGQNTRSLEQNKRDAFLNMTNNKLFKDWMKIKIAKFTVSVKDIPIEDVVNESMKEENIKIEIHDEDGNWIEVKDIKK